jgi:hypothetical protein
MEQQAVDVRGAGGELHLVRDLLDKQLVDRNHDPMGRADGLIMGVAGDGPPRLLCIESGITVLARRLGRRLGRWTRAASRRWGLRRGRPMRIEWSKVVKIAIETELDVEADRTPALAWEHWLLEHVVRHIPSLKPEEREKRRQGSPTEPAAAPPAADAPRGRWRRIRVHNLLNRQVLDAEGRPAGRVEELRACVRDGQCFVEEYVLGRQGLMERLSIADLSLVALRALGARHGAPGHRVPWHQMDLTDPRKPRLRCKRADLER